MSVFDNSIPKQQKKILYQIVRERERQEQKWGDQSHHPFGIWSMILGEEKGEVDRACLEKQFGKGSIQDIKTELIQTAAVCVAWLESLGES